MPAGACSPCDDAADLHSLLECREEVPDAAQALLIERAVRGPHGGQLRSAVAALATTSTRYHDAR